MNDNSREIVSYIKVYGNTNLLNLALELARAYEEWTDLNLFIAINS